jgi:transcriptional regulator with XRE-family HTH domain
MANQFGERIKQLREDSGLLQRHVASQMDMDTPMLSKIERGDRKARKEQVLLFNKILKGNLEELLTLWLTDQVVDVVKNEDFAINAIQMAERELKTFHKNNNA